MRRPLLLIALLAIGVAAAWATGLLERLDVEGLRELVDGAGAWGPTLFVLLFGLPGLGFPALLFLLAAIALWPPWQAFVFCWLGSLVAASVGFFYARNLGREFIAARLPERVRRFERRVVERGVQTVVLIRLAFFLAPWAHWALGLSPVGWRAYLIGSALGLLPGIAVFTFFGGAALEWLAAQSGDLWIDVAAGVLALLVALFVWRRLRRPAPAPAD